MNMDAIPAPSTMRHPLSHASSTICMRVKALFSSTFEAAQDGDQP